MKILLLGFLIVSAIIFTISEFGRDIPDIDYRIISTYHNNLLKTINKDSLMCNYLIIVDSTEVLSNEQYNRNKMKLQNEIDHEVLEDFEEKNSKRFCYANFFTIKFEYKIINQNEIDTIFNQNYWEEKRNSIFDKEEKKKYRGGWSEYYKRYPNSCGYRSFSRIGLNKQKNKALFYISNVGGPLAGIGYFVYMGKVNNKWNELKTIEDWIS